MKSRNFPVITTVASLAISGGMALAAEMKSGNIPVTTIPPCSMSMVRTCGQEASGQTAERPAVAEDAGTPCKRRTGSRSLTSEATRPGRMSTSARSRTG